MCCKASKRTFANPFAPALVIVIFFIKFCPSSSNLQPKSSTPSLPASSEVSLGHRNSILNSPRSKRSPFVVAFQVTRPPGLFQLSMRRPVIMGVMSNMTSMVLGSELARLLSRSLNTQQFFLPSNTTSSNNTA